MLSLYGCLEAPWWGRERGAGATGKERKIRVEGRPPSEEAVSTTAQGACRTGAPGKSAVTLIALMSDQIQEGPRMFFFLSFFLFVVKTLFSFEF